MWLNDLESNKHRGTSIREGHYFGTYIKTKKFLDKIFKNTDNVNGEVKQNLYINTSTLSHK